MVFRLGFMFLFYVALTSAAYWASADTTVQSEVASAEYPSGPAIWRLADEDTEVYLFGSIHVLREDAQWFSPRVKRLLDHTDVLYLETNTHTRRGRRQMLEVINRDGQFARRGFFGARGGLKSRLTPQEYSELKKALKVLNIPFSRIQTYRPWFAAFYLWLHESNDSGYTHELGVENVLLDYVGKDVKQRFFASGAQQINHLANLDKDVQIEMLISTVRRINSGESGSAHNLNELVSAWLKGDIEALTQVSASQERQASAEYQSLIVARNEVWAAKLDKVLREEEGRFFVVAGTAHFVGPDSVQEQLKSLGYQIEEF